MGSAFHYLDTPDFVPDWSNTLSSFAKMSVIFKPLPWVGKIMDSLPEGLVTKLNPGMALMFSYQARCRAIIKSVVDAYHSGSQQPEFKRPTFFHDIVSSELPEREKTPVRLAQELQIVVAAGSETVAKFLSWTTYFLLENSEKLEKMKEELNRLDPDRKASLVDLENFPYLVSVRKPYRIAILTHINQTSVMLEGLRYVYCPFITIFLHSLLHPPSSPSLSFLFSLTSIYLYFLHCFLSCIFNQHLLCLYSYFPLSFTNMLLPVHFYMTRPLLLIGSHFYFTRSSYLD